MSGEEDTRSEESDSENGGIDTAEEVGEYEPAFKESQQPQLENETPNQQRVAQQGALAAVLEKYDPEEFNEFVEGLVDTYQEMQQSRYGHRKSILNRAIMVVLGLFVGMVILTQYTSLAGESVVFFAGIIVGYIMSLANELV